jgi:hypothetical protein
MLKNIFLNISSILIICLTLNYTSISIKALSKDFDYMESDFLKENPSLNKFIYKKPHSNIYLGLGITPLAITDNRFILAGSLFQLHYIKNNWDFELFNISVGLNQAEESLYSSYHFIIRTAPKIKIYSNLSLGVILGWEFISFPNVNKKEYKNQYFTPIEPFSTNGGILGIILTQEFKYYGKYIIQINEFIYREFYSVYEAKYSWKYWFEDDKIEQDPDRKAIAPSFVGGIEISILF